LPGFNVSGCVIAKLVKIAHNPASQVAIVGHSESERDHPRRVDIACCVLILRARQEIALLNIFNAWVEAAQFGADVQRVMTLRMMRIASGGPDAITETHRMVSEKASAFGEAHVALFTALMSGKSLEAAAAKAYAPYRSRVSANSRRLAS
jgi:hypothetical protein